MKNYLDISYLKATGKQPQWFGLGFIQLKLSKTHRMHFWHPDMQPKDFEEEIHDHRYDFKSTILKGSMDTEIWGFKKEENTDFQLVNVGCDTKNKIDPEFVAYVEPYKICSFASKTNDTYTLDKDTFHRVQSSMCVSLIEREPTVKDKARVIKPMSPHVCPFSNNIPEHILWDRITEILNMEDINYNLLNKPAYHVADIKKGKVGEISKIEEEVAELRDAAYQNCKIMELVELSDLIGAIESYLDNKHPETTFSDLKTMSDITKRAFKNGARK